MAAKISFFMSPEDEKVFFRTLSQLKLELYPEVIPPDWKAPLLSEVDPSTLTEDFYTLAAVDLEPVEAHKFKRGPHKGCLFIDEVHSPVIQYRRCMLEEGTLLAGSVWAEVQTFNDSNPRVTKSESFRKIFENIQRELKRRLIVRSRPSGFLIGPGANRLHEKGVVLREAGHKGRVIEPS